ncbi:MAG: T9SS type A sorting domain-containing protein [Ignavibacteria bacterium]|nr:T9SS type A sorting domain-containing protein [Ignavibacteria bacterium]
MKTIIIITALTLSLTNTLFSQWTMIRNVSGEELYCVDFVNSNTGYAAGSIPFSSSLVIKTTDGGYSWNYVYVPIDGDRIECIDFLNANLGWAGTYNGILLKTTNGGINWTSRQIITGVDSRILKMKFTDENRGFISTERGYYYISSGGNAYSPIVLNYPPYFGQDMYFFNSTTGYVSSAADLFKTTNGGVSYSNIFNHNTGEKISSINFINQNTGWAIGNHRLVMKTINGGVNWNLISMDSIQEDCHDLVNTADFANENVGYYVGLTFCGGIWGTSESQLFRKTTDGGMTWNRVTYYTGLSAIEDFQFIDSLKAVMVGYHGAVYRNNFAGLTGIDNFELSIPEKFSLSQNYPNPFNPKTVISYELQVPGFAKLIVYNVLGNEVAVLVNEKLNAGKYSVDFDGNGFSSGVYFYKLEAGEFSETKRMILLK